MDTMKTIKLTDIVRSDDNLREEYDGISELADSIAFIGLMEPIRVAKEGNKWRIMAGHRRYEALLHLGWEDTKCVVQSGKVTDEARTAGFLIENLQRVDLTPKETVEGVRRLLTDYGMKQAEIAKSLGVSRDWVKQRVAMLNVPEHCFADDKWGRPLSVESLAQLGGLTDDRLTRLTDNDKVPSQYDIETQAQKQSKQERVEKLQRKLLKDGHLVTTEKEMKQILKTDVAELTGTAQLIKLTFPDATTIVNQRWDVKDEVAIYGERVHAPDKHEFEKSAVYMVRSVGGFMEFDRVEQVLPKAMRSEEPEDLDDEVDRIDQANEELRTQHRAACVQAEADYVADAKPAELVNSMLIRALHEMNTGYQIRYYADVFNRLGIEHEPFDPNPGFDERDEIVDGLFELLWQYASKNASNLARAAATVLMVTARRHSFPVEYPEDPEYLEYPDEEEVLTPLETGV